MMGYPRVAEGLARGSLRSSTVRGRSSDFENTLMTHVVGPRADLLFYAFSSPARIFFLKSKEFLNKTKRQMLKDLIGQKPAPTKHRALLASFRKQSQSSRGPPRSTPPRR